MKLLFLDLSVLAAVVSPVIGIRAIILGTFQPQRMTRFLIFIISLHFVGTLIAAGDKNGIYIALTQLFGSFIILSLSIKKGLGGYSKFDLLIFFLAMISLIVWQTTSNSLLGLLMSIVTDVIGMIPTLIKTWKLPHTEEWKFYLSDVIASFFSLLSIQSYSLSTLAFPIYIFLINSTSVLMILGRRKVLTHITGYASPMQ